MFKKQAELFKMARHVHIDFETLATTKRPAVLQFGWVISDVVDGKQEKVHKACIDLDIGEQLYLGRDFDQKTYDTFWRIQADDVRQSVFMKHNRFHLHDTLRAFLDSLEARSKVSPGRQTFLWSNGLLDDAVWLKSLFEDSEAFEDAWPFAYNKVMCYRTEMIGLKDWLYSTHQNPLAHNAGADAEFQADVFINMVNNYDQVVKDIDRICGPKTQAEAAKQVTE